MPPLHMGLLRRKQSPGDALCTPCTPNSGNNCGRERAPRRKIGVLIKRPSEVTDPSVPAEFQSIGIDLSFYPSELALLSSLQPQSRFTFLRLADFKQIFVVHLGILARDDGVGERLDTTEIFVLRGGPCDGHGFSEEAAIGVVLGFRGRLGGSRGEFGRKDPSEHGIPAVGVAKPSWCAHETLFAFVDASRSLVSGLASRKAEDSPARLLDERMFLPTARGRAIADEAVAFVGAVGPGQSDWGHVV